MPDVRVGGGDDNLNVDAAVANEAVDQATRARERLLRERDDLRLGLARARGLLGADCEDCGDPIAECRLRALPGARRCYACQGAAERGVGRADRLAEARR